MRAQQQLTDSLHSVLQDMGLAWPDKASISPPSDKKFGDLAANLPLVLAKGAGRKPHDLAEEIATRLKKADPHIVSITIAGPGFINVTYANEFWQSLIPTILREGSNFGKNTVAVPQRIQVEYVSANPTGPLHVGHGRGAAVGDSLARILRFVGHEVETEYYINDAGRQMRLLGVSVWLRVLELQKLPVDYPEDWYKGDYIIDIARDMLVLHPTLAAMPEKDATALCFDYAMKTILAGIKQDLINFRVDIQVWFSEQSLIDSKALDMSLAVLKKSGHSYEKDGALWFNTTALGDDKDRVLRKNDGNLTYFASDIAYHADKYKRKFDFVVDVWGADHHGYIPRMRAAVAALGQERDAFDVLLVQLVNLLRNGQQIAMSTRAGEFVTLAEVVQEVGADAARFIFLSRKHDSSLDFDLELLKQRTMDNPVYYVQYAHARICAIFRKAFEQGILLPEVADMDVLQLLTEPDALDLLKTLEQFSVVVHSSAAHLAPHHVSYYLLELASSLHKYYTGHSILNAGDDTLVKARLYLLRAVQQVICNGLTLLGVTAPESM